MSSACFVMSAIPHHMVLGGCTKELIMLHSVFVNEAWVGLAVMAAVVMAK